MKTVSTKIDLEDHHRLLELCNKEGCTVSEIMRDLITGYCSSCKKLELQEPKLISQVKVMKIIDSDVDESKSHHDRYGNYWTFDKKADKWTCYITSKNIKN
jgi:hypothetical protein